MTHGFDDQGRQYDHKGNLCDWWEKADAEEYERRVAVQVWYLVGTPTLALALARTP